jgi:hypothetical protein
VSQQVPRERALPELVEAGRVAGHGGFEVVADLTVEGRALADQVATVADEQLQRGPSLVAGGFQKRAARDGSAVDGSQVCVVSLVAGINRLAVLLGDKRMEDAGLETSGAEGALHDPVITAGAFDGDHAVADLVLLEGQPDLRDGGVEIGPVVLNHGRGDELAAVKVGEEELGTDLVAVKADDAEVFGTDLLHPGMEHATGLADRAGSSTAGRTTTGTSAGHRRSLPRKTLGSSHFRSWRSELVFLDKTHIPGVRNLFLASPRLADKRKRFLTPFPNLFPT